MEKSYYTVEELNYKIRSIELDIERLTSEKDSVEVYYKNISTITDKKEKEFLRSLGEQRCENLCYKINQKRKELSKLRKILKRMEE